MNIAEPLIRIENRLESLVNDVKNLQKDMNKVNQSLDNLKNAVNKHEKECITKKSEKKYRPFTNEEFIELFDLGKFHSIRKIDELYDRLIITNIYRSKDNYLYMSLNGDDLGYGLYWFFKKCEYFDGKEWKHFGVEE